MNFIENFSRASFAYGAEVANQLCAHGYRHIGQAASSLAYLQREVENLTIIVEVDALQGVNGKFFISVTSRCGQFLEFWCSDDVVLAKREGRPDVLSALSSVEAWLAAGRAWPMWLPTAAP